MIHELTLSPFQLAIFPSSHERSNKIENRPITDLREWKEQICQRMRKGKYQRINKEEGKGKYSNRVLTV